MTQDLQYSPKSPVVIATHSGGHHADDVVGTAVLMYLFPAAALVRTRDASLISAADFAVDVGGEWDPARGRFDHHQKGFTGKREDATAYASAGLVWDAYGKAFVLQVAREHAKTISDTDAHEVVRHIDEELMVHLDRADTGEAAGAPGLFGLSALLAQFNPSWQEEQGLDAPQRDFLKRAAFDRAMETALVLIKRSVLNAMANLQGYAAVRQGKLVKNGRVLILDESGLDWEPVVCGEMPEVLFVIYPDSTDNQFQVRTVPVELRSFKARKDLPRPWAGLRAKELAAASGVEDAVFCHNGVFIAGTETLEGALKMAQLALDNEQ